MTTPGPKESNSFAFSASGLSSAVYEVRAVVTAGNGTAGIRSAEFFTPASTATLTGKASSKYQRSHRIALTGSAPWDIRLRRITPDSGRTSLQNKTIFDSYTEIIDAKLRYPNSALVALTIDSSQFRAIPRRAYDVKLLKIQVPANYNPVTRAYTGTWDGTFTTAWSDNPAWVFYDLLTTARYGLGEFIDATQVDKWGLYRIAQYCDALVPNGMGGLEPRFTCNVYLQTREEAYKVMQDLASCFRGMTYWASGAITAVQDAPEDATHLYTPANVIDGLFTYSGSSGKVRHTVALVAWNDPSDMYRRKVEYVEDTDGIARYGVVETEITAIGCVSRGQAHRAGKWLLYSERLESETVTFRVGMDSALARPGAIIKVADPVRAGERRGGRVSSAATSTVHIDQAVTIGAGTYTLSVHEPSGAVQERTLSNSPGTTTVLTVTDPFYTAPAAQAIWLLSSDDLEPQTFRVISVVETERHQFEILALAHNTSKYGAIERDLALEAPDISNLRNLPATPENPHIHEQLYEFQNQIRVLVSISWEPVPNAFSYVVWWYRDNGNWQVTEHLQTPELEIRDAQPGSYGVRVWAVNAIGLKSGTPATLSAITVYGKTLPPSDVLTFTALQNNDVVLFKWSQVPDVDLAGYEVRYAVRSVYDGNGADVAWDAGTIVTSATRGTSVTTAAVPPGDWTFLIKAVDTSGLYSATPAVFSTEIVAPASFEEITSLRADPEWDGWEVVRHSSMWAGDGAAMWENGVLKWNADSTVLMWAANDLAFMYDAGGIFWTTDGDLETLWSADPGTLMWLGEAMWTGSGFYRHWTGVLVPKSGNSASIDEWETFDEFVPNPDRCIYDMPEIDQSFDARARVYSTIGAALGPGETGVPEVDFYLDWRTEAGEWHGMELWGIGEITGRYSRPRLRLETPTVVSKITSFGVTLDADASIQSGDQVGIAASGTAIVFSPAYHNVPRLQLSAQSASGAGRFATFENLTETGFTARVFDAAGNDVGGFINWDAAGV